MEGLTPPRAGRAKSLRPLGYGINRAVDRLPRGMPDRLARVFRGDSVLPGESVAAMLLSVVPGLGHLMSGRRKAAALVFGVWLVAVILTVNFYYGATGTLLFAFLVGGHAGVVFDAGRARDTVRSLRDRLRIMLFLLIPCAGAYFIMDRVANRFVSFVASPFALRSLNIDEGDVLRISRGPHEWRRGDLCTVSRPGGGHYVGGAGVVFRTHGDMLVAVLGLPGDRVEVSSEGVRVNGRSLALDMLPEGSVPLPKEPISLTIPEGHLLAVTPVQLPDVQNPQSLVATVWRNLYSLPESSVVGRATGIYLPFSRRRSFKEPADRERRPILEPGIRRGRR
ncbi:MAG: S26 family signal peptidase [Planctomycetota bacterium]